MALDFPNSPSVNDSFSAGGKTWVYNGTKWVLLGVSLNQAVADGAITTAKIADSAITASKIADGTIVAAEIANNAITTAKILDANVTQAKLGTTLSAVTVTTAANRDTAVASPFTGQLVFLTDTKKIQVWDGTSWLNITLAPPETPTSLSATALSTTSVSIAFTAGGANGSPITNYKYALSTNSGSTYGSFVAVDPADATTPITISGLTAATAYYIKLKAVNDMGDSVASAAVSITTLTPLSISGGQETVTVGGFKYVVFTSSGTLTVTNSGTVGICTVGGGGGGGSNIAGGGGGGELDLFADFNVASNLTITVGSAGIGGVSSTSRGTNGGTSTVVEGVTTHQSALGGGGGGTYNPSAGMRTGAGGGSGGGGEASFNSAGGAASGSNTFAGGAGISSAVYYGGGGGGATAVGSSSVGTGGQGYALSSIDANLTAANFPTTLTGITHISSGGGGGQYFGSGFPSGGTNGGTGGRESAVSPTNATGYGGGGGGGGDTPITGALGFAGLVICRIVA